MSDLHGAESISREENQMPPDNAVLEGGPVDGATIYAPSNSLMVYGEDHGRDGEVARYRRTNRTTPGGLKVYAFRGWDTVVVRVPVP